MSDTISEDRLRNTRAWAASRIGQMSGAEVIVGAIDELLHLRALTLDPAGANVSLHPVDDGLREIECPHCHGVGGGRGADGVEQDCSLCDGHGGLLIVRRSAQRREG